MITSMKINMVFLDNKYYRLLAHLKVSYSLIYSLLKFKNKK